MTWIGFTSLFDSRSTCFPVYFQRRCLMYTHHCRGWSSAWLCSYIPLRWARPSCISSLFSIHNHLNPHSASTVALIHSRPSFCFPDEEHHYNPNLIIMISCPLAPSIPSGSCVCDIAIREQTGAAFVLITLFSVSFRNLVYPSGTVSFRFLFGSTTQSYSISPVCEQADAQCLVY